MRCFHEVSLKEWSQELKSLDIIIFIIYTISPQGTWLQKGQVVIG